MSKVQFTLVEQEVLEMLKKGAIRNVVPTKRVIFEQPLPCRKKKRWREPPSENLKSQQINSLGAFQYGRSALFEIPSRAGRFAMQDRSQGGIFFSSPQQKFTKVSLISMVMQP